jgi:pimeloyl-ACP methyl ester carboxylesterase
VVFVPPLIGGNLSQQLGIFRWLIRRQWDLISFNYAGHGNSSNKFSLGGTIRDTKHMLSWACRLTDKEGLPLFAIGSCYSALPLLHAVHHLGEPVKRLVLVNAIPRLGPRAVMMSFMAYYKRLFPSRRGFPELRASARKYADALFPDIAKGMDHFGELKRRRARLLKTVSEFLTLRPLDGVFLIGTPVLCLYGRKDRVLQIYDEGIDVDYQKNIREICPQVLFRSLDGDHFLSPPIARSEAAQHIAAFFRKAG